MHKATGIQLTIANTIIDLVQGDIKEHLSASSIPLRGDVLGLGTTTSIDNGELAFVYDESASETSIFKCHANTGGIHKVCTGDGSDHFPYVCFSTDATDKGNVIDLALLKPQSHWRLADWIAAAIDTLEQPAELYGVRARCQWQDLVITVASKLCMTQTNRNAPADAEAGSGAAVYDALQHYILSTEAPAPGASKIEYLGDSLHWDCCGFFDVEPEKGRVTVAQAGAHLHIHGVSTDHRYGGHLHHEHALTHLKSIDDLVIYPIEAVAQLGSDLAVNDIHFEAGFLHFEVTNLGQMDVSDIGIDVVPNDCYSQREYLRLPWLSAGESEKFCIALHLERGDHRILVAVDAVGDVIEPEGDRGNNRAWLNTTIA